MIIALLTGGDRAIIEARKSSPTGSKTCWAHLSEENWLVEIFMKEFGKTDTDAYNNHFRFAAFRGTHNAFMLFKLAAHNLVAHKTCDHMKLLKLLEMADNYRKVTLQHQVEIRNSDVKVAEVLARIEPETK